MVSIPSLALYSVFFLSVVGGFISFEETDLSNKTVWDKIDEIWESMKDLSGYLDDIKEYIEDPGKLWRDIDDKLGITDAVGGAVESIGDTIRSPFNAMTEFIQEEIYNSIILGGSLGIELGSPLQYFWTAGVVAVGISSFIFFIWGILSLKNLIL